MTAAEALRAAIPRLARAGVPEPQRDARALLAHALRISPGRLSLVLPEDLDEDAAARFGKAIAAREGRQPVSQITGRRLFWGHSFKVTRDTLDPRPETELVVAAALERRFSNVLDLGTGTGCILLSCLAGMPEATGVGADISPAALAVAQDNANALGFADRARFIESDWFSAIDGSFDLIVSNPPYIAADEMAELSPEVRDWEPHGALSPGGDGLDAYRALAHGAGGRLSPGGRIILEIGPTQAAAVSQLLRVQDFEGIEVRRDFDGRYRIVIGVKS
ncbi:peptide chain release factor N(5)-glutamine methyltransferase [Defluviimonas sp. WL0002]|uniref:Release factor glutamine methyltransferase n=1 Tax=Albidovulum marisflavi TaxID=2984159 RepID=A0ABT2ZH89_9RHOB|nr:peptide chain release factor N(5)-glutamine methyltransferase [Defluviimonas sp. WL0002]MCV2870503.1 peptide chain release factor N(5)-glutamine methyltransferase [Defluviimonas sp. WL0002]